MELDCIFSIGPACRPAYHLKQNFLRLFAAPLDWQMNYNLDTCLHLFQTSFETFFSEIYADPARNGARNNRYVIDTQNSITSIHHFDSSLPLDEAQAKFRTTMKKRYESMHNAILNSHAIGLICNREDSLDVLSSFLLSFGKIYPDTQIVLINIRHNETLTSISMNEYHLTSRLIIREYSFCDTYQTAKNSDRNFWLGNVDAWNNILQDCCIIHHPFAEYIKNIISQTQTISLYGAGIYCRKIINFLKKYDINISHIVVTSLENNPVSIEGIPVISYDALPKPCYNHPIIISVIDETESLKILHQLKTLGYASVFRIDSSLRLLL